MNSPWYKVAAIFLFVVGLIATLAWLTQTEEDPCLSPQADVSAAVLAESAEDQDGLVNRAILVRGECNTKDDKAKDSIGDQ